MLVASQFRDITELGWLFRGIYSRIKRNGGADAHKEPKSAI
jgi:hypothetical protein